MGIEWTRQALREDSQISCSNKIEEQKNIEDVMAHPKICW